MTKLISKSSQVSDLKYQLVKKIGKSKLIEAQFRIAKIDGSVPITCVGIFNENIYLYK